MCEDEGLLPFTAEKQAPAVSIRTLNLVDSFDDFSSDAVFALSWQKYRRYVGLPPLPADAPNVAAEVEGAETDEVEAEDG